MAAFHLFSSIYTIFSFLLAHMLYYVSGSSRKYGDGSLAPREYFLAWVNIVLWLFASASLMFYGEGKNVSPQILVLVAMFYIFTFVLFTRFFANADFMNRKKKLLISCGVGMISYMMSWLMTLTLAVT